MQEPKSPSGEAVDRLILEQFLPYRLSVLANRVSGSLSRSYSARFDLGIPQWRVLAVLGRFPSSSASEIVERSAMDKVTVSRAVSRLIAKGLIRRQADASDRRRSALSFTTEGEAVYREIVPLARAFARQLTDVLSDEETAELDRLLGKLLDRVGEIEA